MKVLPLRIRVAARDAVLLEGRLGGQVKAADTGDFEWELMNSANDGTRLVVTMQKWYVLMRTIWLAVELILSFLDKRCVV